MKHDRMARVNRLLQTTLADMVPGLVKDPRVADLMVSVVEVRATPDLRQAKVFVSLLGSTPDQEQTALEALKQARGFLRGELGRRVRLRYTPELLFTLDGSQAYAARIERILGEIKTEAGDSEGADSEQGSDAADEVAEDE